MSNIVYIAASIDGYIADKEGRIDWLMSIPNPAGSDYGYSELIERVDAIVMGRKTYETVLGFGLDQWPYAKKVFVLSNTLKHTPADLTDRVEIVTGELASVVENIKSLGFENLYVDGGKTIQGFLRLDMIDELIITRVPVILGSGIPLFDEIGVTLRFEHVETNVYSDIFVKSRYVRAR